MYTVTFSPTEEGTHELNVLYDGVPVSQRPLTFECVSGFDETRCSAHGPGLERGIVGKPCEFTVDTKGAGVGQLNLMIEGPSKAIINQVDDKQDGSCAVRYEVSEPGEYKISIYFGDRHILGSPFHSTIEHKVDPSKVIAFGPGVEQSHCRAEVPLVFQVDAGRSGYAPLSVTLDPETPVHSTHKQPPVTIIEKGKNLYEVTYYAPPVGTTFDLHVLHGGKDIQNSPYRLKVLPKFEPGKVKIKGMDVESLGEVPASLPLTLTLDSTAAGVADIEASIMDPNNQLRPIQVTEYETGLTDITFVPDDIGSYIVDVKFANEEVPGSPFKLKSYAVGDAEKCWIAEGREEIVPINHSLCTRVICDDDQNAAVTCRITPLDPDLRRPDINVKKSTNDNVYSIYYTLRSPGAYKAAIKYGGNPIKYGEWIIRAVSREDFDELKKQNKLLGSFEGLPEQFWNFALNAGAGKVTAEVILPSKSVDVPTVIENDDGSITVRYQPQERGIHELHIKQNGAHVKGSPFTFEVEQIGEGFVTVYGAGLCGGTAGQPAAFTICAKDLRDIKGTLMTLARFSARFLGRNDGEKKKRANISVGSTNEVSLKVAQEDVIGLSATITSPSGIEEPCTIRRVDKNLLGISFTPREAGEHLITVKKGDTLVPGSPFRIMVKAADVGDASKVAVSGTGLKTAHTQQPNTFFVDTRKAGSPFTVTCAGEGLGMVTNKTEQMQDAPPVIQPGDECQLYFKIPEANPADMSAMMMHPDGLVEDVELTSASDGVYIVRFTPRIPGLHTISILHKGIHVSGSPFQYTVGPLSEGGAHKIRAGGTGLVKGEVNKSCIFNIYCREAGVGVLSVIMEGPSKADLTLKQLKDGNCFVSYLVSKPGEYTVAILFDEMHIPDSPFRVYISPGPGEGQALEVSSLPYSPGLPTDKPIALNISSHGAKGKLEAKVINPNGVEEECQINPTEEGGSYVIRFTPKECGNYYVHLKIDGVPVKDSPFLIRVGEPIGSDPAAIVVSGSGLSTGETGHNCEFLVDNSQAGAGNLQVQIDGPSKVALGAYEVDKGYVIRYTPMAPGVYFLAIKYNGIHIPGSPFKVLITGKTLVGTEYSESSRINIAAVSKSPTVSTSVYNGDASKVKCRGAGLKRAYVGRKNTFSVDCSSA
ncbi:unnamed protein product, partial [Soboliphyme baturini]|uniref:Filamin-A n=1 Tax=Soboliphyme baturini TaxID=241478 RepID=A0A183IGK8_9BILA